VATNLLGHDQIAILRVGQRECRICRLKLIGGAMELLAHAQETEGGGDGGGSKVCGFVA